MVLPVAFLSSSRLLISWVTVLCYHCCLVSGFLFKSWVDNYLHTLSLIPVSSFLGLMVEDFLRHYVVFHFGIG
jgi:hypothetical protein